MTTKQETGIDWIFKIIMGIAATAITILIANATYTMRSQALEISDVKRVNAEQSTEIAVLKVNYLNIEKNLNEILLEVRKNNEKLDRHMAKDKQ